MRGDDCQHFSIFRQAEFIGYQLNEVASVMDYIKDVIVDESASDCLLLLLNNRLERLSILDYKSEVLVTFAEAKR